MRGGPTVTITESDVTAALDMATAIDVIERALRAQAEEQAVDMTKTHAAWKGGQLHALGGVLLADGIAGTKTWVHTTQGAAPRLLLFDTSTGAALASIEAFALGQLRTGAVTGVATRWLAPADADELAIIGTGKQARSQIAAVRAVRPIRRIRVYSPTAAHRQQLVASLRTERDLGIVDAPSVAAGVADAPIVTLATRATSPFLSIAQLGAGAHVNAIGAITPERAELTSDVLDGAASIVVDSIPAARLLSGEIMTWIDRGGSWERVRSLATLVAARRPRAPDTGISVFKAMGMGLCDVALGAEVYRRARQSADRFPPARE